MLILNRYPFFWVVLLLGGLVAGCSTPSPSNSSQGPSDSLNTQTDASGLWLPYGKTEAFLSTGQERALKAVREYERGVTRLRQVDYHYVVHDVPSGYKVTIHYGLGHVANEPILPGASMIYLVDLKGNVQKRTVS